MAQKPDPCLSCGACCAHYRASFYWREADDATSGGVPVALTEDLNQHYRAMKGTTDTPPRCTALTGLVGGFVACSTYANRASVCREFLVSWENGESNERCDAARLAHGLPPLLPQDWRHDPNDTDRPRPLQPAA